MCGHHEWKRATGLGEMGNNGYAKYAEQHTWDAVSRRVCEAIASVLT